MDLPAGLGARFPGQSADLAVVDRADPLFRKQIGGRCELLAGRARDLHELRMYPQRRYQDCKPCLARERRLVQGPGRAGRGGRRIDVDCHLLTQRGQPPPRDHYRSFVEPGGRVVPADFATRIAAAACLRNRIAHECDDIAPGRLFEGMEAAARDIPVWTAHVVSYPDSRAG